MTETPAGNSTFAIGGGLCSKDSFVVNQTLVFCINICGENRHLRQAQKRWLLRETLTKAGFVEKIFVKLKKYVYLQRNLKII